MYLVGAGWGGLGGLHCYWRGALEVYQPVDFTDWRALVEVVRERLRQARLEMVSVACAARRREVWQLGSVTLRAEVRRFMIRVWNLHEGDKQPWKGRGHYVGRPSPLGNPFPIREDCNRAAAIEKFREWLREIVRKARAGEVLEGTHAAAWAEMVMLYEASHRGDVNLLCYCKPLPCHADVIKVALESLKANASEWMQEQVERRKDEEQRAIAESGKK